MHKRTVAGAVDQSPGHRAFLHWLEDHLVADFGDADFLAVKPKILRQANRLTAAVREKLRCRAHGSPHVRGGYLVVDITPRARWSITPPSPPARSPARRAAAPPS